MIGLNDFIEYWTAARLFLEGSNLYDPALMAKLQQEQGFTANPPLMMWMPPWALLYLLPFLAFSLHTSAALWAAASIVLTISSTLLWQQILGIPKQQRIFLVVAALSFLPTLTCLMLGQVSLLLFFLFSLGMYGIHRRYDFLTGFCLISLSWKPHLFLLFALVLLWWIVKQGRFRILWGSIAGLLLSVLASLVISPNSLNQWINSFIAPIDGAPSKLSWITPTIVGMTRLGTAETGTFPVWPMVVIPGLALILGFYYFAFYKRRISLEQNLSLLLCLSFCFAPFAWVFDAVLLLPSLLLLLHICFERFPAQRLVVVALFSTSQVLALYLHSTVLQTHHSFVWLPLLFLTLELVRQRFVQQ